MCESEGDGWDCMEGEEREADEADPVGGVADAAGSMCREHGCATAVTASVDSGALEEPRELRASWKGDAPRAGGMARGAGIAEVGHTWKGSHCKRAR